MPKTLLTITQSITIEGLILQGNLQYHFADAKTETAYQVTSVTTRIENNDVTREFVLTPLVLMKPAMSSVRPPRVKPREALSLATYYVNQNSDPLLTVAGALIDCEINDSLTVDGVLYSIEECAYRFEADDAGTTVMSLEKWIVCSTPLIALGHQRLAAQHPRSVLRELGD